mmetsp:Transcript_24970/g.54752  ORF Transcript_24970/g.54752 Transcript_24970/m.54752 type:complete len:112 (+) Transcript_24970:175-510(+)|eukprot:CAMPEP_0168253080 /NCGR_PEP_ID=MMETSP0141_2-20121125/3976_1 /TAXON_ID=44445 /ORGANISM="Pseudo-nitzschia australis, Strain 10249 10 AB" /LENGTH=111 /DNA_ID=CAMNT_0008189381 /DNA_START=92 /DNA_END=427 /DNA_ORIENTATION=-
MAPITIPMGRSTTTTTTKNAAKTYEDLWQKYLLDLNTIIAEVQCSHLKSKSDLLHSNALGAETETVTLVLRTKRRQFLSILKETMTKITTGYFAEYENERTGAPSHLHAHS